MKRLSRMILTALVVTVLALSLVGCKSTAKVEPIPPAPVVEPAPEPEPPVAEVVPVPEPVAEPAPEPVVEAPPVVVAEPVFELVGEDLPYGGKQVIKNADGQKTFDLFIVHTNDLDGDIYGEAGGLGLAKLSTALQAGKAISDNWLLLNAGSVGEIPVDLAELAAETIDVLGYDAYTPQAIQFATGVTGTKAAALSVNALDPEGYFVTQPYAVYDFNGYKVGVAGLSAPQNIAGVSFDSDLIFANAQFAVDLANDYVDYLVVLSDLGSRGAITSEMIATYVDGIDLIVDGNGRAMYKEINDTLLVRADEKLKSIGAVQLSVVDGKLVGEYAMRVSAADVSEPYKSPLAAAYESFANAMGYTLQVVVPEDPAMVSLIGRAPVAVAEVPKVVVEEPKVVVPEVVEPVKVVAAEPAVVPPVVVAEPVFELVGEDLPYGGKQVIKNADGQKTFDLFIVHTNDLDGDIYGEAGGLGLAKLSTALQAGKAISDNWLLLNAGSVGEIPVDLAELAAETIDVLGYDAYTPQAIQFATGVTGTKAAALSVNALDPEGYFVTQPYAVYDFNGYKVGVAGLSAPQNIAGVSFDSDLIFANAQFAVDLANDYVDYLVVLSDLGSRGAITSEMIATYVDGIDLIVDGNGRAMYKEINDTLLVRADEKLKSIGAVQLSVVDGKLVGEYAMRVSAADVSEPYKSPLAAAYESFANAMGYTLQVVVPEDPAIVSLIGRAPVAVAEVPKVVVPEVVEPVVEVVAVEPVVEAPPVVVVEPVFELVGEDLPYGGKQVIKNADGQKTFDLFIVHTNDLDGDIYGEAGGLGLAKLSTALQAGKAISDNWLLLNAGSVGEIPVDLAELAAETIDVLGYDAYTPQAIQFATGVTGTKAAALSVNALDPEGYFVTQPYAVYDFNGYKVGVAGLSAPQNIAGVSFDSDLIFANAQFAVDLANDYVDYLVVLSDLGSRGAITSEMIATYVDGIDLIVDGNGRAMYKEINDTLLVRADEKLKSIGAVQLSVVDGKLVGEYAMRVSAADVSEPYKSPLAAAYESFANAMGYTLQVVVPEDPAMVSLIGRAPVAVAEVPKVVVEEPKVVVPEVVEPVKVVAAEPAVVPPVVVAEPVFELVGEDLPYGGKQVIKNADGQKTFDLFIVHTNDLDGDIYGEAGGLGLAKLSTALQAGKAISDNWLLLNAGSVGEIPVDLAELAAETIDVLGYDAYTPQAIQFATGVTGTKAAALSVNALDPEGYFVTQPYAVYDFNGYKVGVAGLSAPQNIAGVSFDSDLIFANAQFAVDLANDYVDYLVVLSDLGSRGAITSEMIATYVDGIDLIVDGNGRAMYKEINDTLLVRADEKLKSIGAVQLSVVDGKLVGEYAMRVSAADVSEPYKSPLAAAYESFANAMGYTLQVVVPEDPAMVSLIGRAPVVVAEVPKVVVEEPKVVVPEVVEVAVVATVPAVVVEEPKARVPMEYPLGVTEIIKSDADYDEFDLFIVHTNDVHARIVPGDGGMGYSKVATLLKGGRAITDNILVLDAGDVTHGTNLANMFEGEPVGVLLDMLGYDAVAPGNHDFNYGADRLIEAAELAELYSDIKVLSANVLDKDGYLLFQPYQVYDFNGFKMAVVGLTTPDTTTKTHPKNVENIYFANEEIFEIGQEAIDIAREYVDYIVVLGHIGLDRDGESGLTSDQIVSRIKGIDLFIDGHSHTVLKEGLVIGDSMIVSAGEYLKYLGLVQLHVKGGKVTATYPMLIPAADVLNAADSELAKEYGIIDVPNDPEVDEYVGYMSDLLNEKLGQVIAYVPEKLNGERSDVRTKPTNLSRLITRAMTEQSGADFTITNGGGIRASMDAGEITMGDVINVLPFTNIITVAEITGADVYAALEHGYRMLPGENGGFSQTDLQVVYNRFAEPGKRIMRVLLNGKAIDKDATYKVATNDFMAAGGDGYTMFGRVLVEGSLLSDVFMEFLQEHYPVP